MGYQVDEGIVRADRFKQSGKWVESLELNMNDFYNEPMVHTAVKKALTKQYGFELDDSKGGNGFIVILEPYHVASFPVVIWL